MPKADAVITYLCKRFWRTLKQEDVYPNRYETLRHARGIDNYMKTYNYQRLHSTTSYKTPMEVYRKQLKLAA